MQRPVFEKPIVTSPEAKAKEIYDHARLTAKIKRSEEKLEKLKKTDPEKAKECEEESIRIAVDVFERLANHAKETAKSFNLSNTEESKGCERDD